MFYIIVLLVIFVFAIAITIVSNGIDRFFEFLDMPIVATDIITVFVSFFAIYYWPKLKMGQYIDSHVMSFSLPKFIGFVILLLFFFLLGVFSTYSGFSAPLELTKNTRGTGSHGYSSAVFGVAILLYSTKFLYLAIIKRCRTRKKVN